MRFPLQIGVLLLALTATCVSTGRSFAAVEPPSTAAVLPGVYTFEQLHQTLVKLGSEFVRVEAENQLCEVKLEHDGMVVYVTLQLRPNDGSLWITNSVSILPAGDAVPAAFMQALLQENSRIHPAYFMFKPASNRINLERRYDNCDWTPARLRRAIEAHDEAVRATYPLWRASAYLRSYGSANVSVTEIARLSGTYEVLAGSIFDGTPVSDEMIVKLKEFPVRIDGGQFFVANAAPVQVFVDPTAQPATIDLFRPNGDAEFGIYRMEGDVLVICVNSMNEARPAGFGSEVKKFSVLRLRRVAG